MAPCCTPAVETGTSSYVASLAARPSLPGAMVVKAGRSPRRTGSSQLRPHPLSWRGPGREAKRAISNTQALSRLRDAYDLKIEEGDPQLGGSSRLVARKRSADLPGPERVQLSYHPGSDVIERMRFEDIPSVKGPPLSLELKLVGEHDLGPDFFEHGSHHAADRGVIQEP